MRIVCAAAAAIGLLAVVGAIVVGCGKKAPVFPNCGDNVVNGEETDVDCGGQICTPCNPGRHCLVNSDCRSKICTANVCAADSCSDGILNGSESDVDCGGPDCPPCADGRTCAGDNDCASKVCTGATCQMPSCGDGIENGNETGVDCGGSCPPCDAAVTPPADLSPASD
jgi:hypothetical protein